MLVWTHEDLFHFPSIETPQDFLNLMLSDQQEIDLYHLPLQTFPPDEAILAKLKSLFPDNRERAAMLDEDGLPSRTWICMPQFGTVNSTQAMRCQRLQNAILQMFKDDLKGPKKVPAPRIELMEGCVKRYCDHLSGLKHDHGYRGREEDWLIP